ncbi:MAG: NADH:ubiquinone reductase (Na(+)-transporting) subunit E [Verrucomicrobia bacterium]|nr:NADH:ubiquinone reductase (Na(+)-transporting) subunit E [Verrucomicrobiota bacterium]MCH8510807.1 NADH:ubiquinone reductase (Na(+)-transporting) subunit E [Kiritimatiellia bacterium]
MTEYIDIFVRAIFVNNMILAYFLGMCSFLALSKKVDTAFGLGLAVVFVLGITTPLNNIIFNLLLKDNTLVQGVDLSFLNFLCFIAVIASTVQLLEMLLDRFFPPLYNSLGIFLPLITVNCSILGGSLFMVERDYNFGQSMAFGFGSGMGFFLAIIALAGIRHKLRYSNIPDGLRGLGITFILTGLMALGFQAFASVTLQAP